MTMKRHLPLTLEYIKRRLRVNVSTGKCFWKDPSRMHMNLIGKEAGNKRRGNGDKYYWVIKIDSIAYLRSQIIYTVKTGEWPSGNLDHKNGYSLDDRGTNIRAATFLENARNRRIGNTRRSLPMGVRSQDNKFAARISVDKKQLFLGSFGTISAAHRAYRAARRKYFGEFA